MIATAYIDIGRVRESIWQARGASGTTDQMVAKALRVDLRDYSSSIEAARGLADRLFPNAVLHVGFDALGILPVATLTGAGPAIAETAPTVPLAILRAIWSASEHAATA